MSKEQREDMHVHKCSQLPIQLSSMRYHKNNYHYTNQHTHTYTHTRTLVLGRSHSPQVPPIKLGRKFRQDTALLGSHRLRDLLHTVAVALRTSFMPGLGGLKTQQGSQFVLAAVSQGVDTLAVGMVAFTFAGVMLLDLLEAREEDGLAALEFSQVVGVLLVEVTDVLLEGVGMV